MEQQRLEQGVHQVLHGRKEGRLSDAPEPEKVIRIYINEN